MLVGVAWASGTQMPPRSYLVTPVRSVDELVRQLDNPSVLNVYVRHYQAPRSEIEAFFKSLHVAKAGRESRAVVYFYDRSSGRINKRLHTVKANDLFFVTKSGNPMLMVKCGNPLGTRIWIPKKEVAVGADDANRAVSPETAVAANPSSGDLVPAAEPVGATVDPLTGLKTVDATSAPADGPPSASQPTNPTDPATASNPTQPTSPEARSGVPLPGQGVFSSIGPGGNWTAGFGETLAAMSFIPLTGAMQRGNGYAAGPAGTSTIISPVPEPGTLVAFGIGTALLVRRRRK